MRDLFGLPDGQMARLRPYFPKSHGRPRGYDRRVLSGIYSSTLMVCVGVMRPRNIAAEDAL